MGAFSLHYLYRHDPSNGPEITQAGSGNPTPTEGGPHLPPSMALVANPEDPSPPPHTPDGPTTAPDLLPRVGSYRALRD